MTPEELRNFCQTVIACADAFTSNEPNREILSLHRRACGYARQGLAELAKAEDAVTKPTRAEVER